MTDIELQVLQQKIIDSGAFRRDGTVDNHWIKNKSHLIDFTGIPGDTINEKLYVIIKNNGEQKKCPICNKPAKFIGYGRGYNTTCSPECKKEFDRQILAKSRELGLNNSEEAKAKRVSTNRERFGVDNPMQNKEIQEKAKQTLISKYGKEYTFQAEEIKEKSKQTSLKRYGRSNPSQNPEIKKKISDKNKEIFKSGGEVNTYIKGVFLERYGVDNPSKVPEIVEKIKEKNKEIFKPDSEVWERQRQTMKEKYGVEFALQSDEVQDRMKENNLKKYGVEYTTMVPEIKHRMLSNKGHTEPEQICEDYLKEKGYSFVYEYEYNGKSFDFGIFKGDKLELLIEIDGEYFHGLNSDKDAKYAGGYTDYLRTRKLSGEQIKLLVIDSKKLKNNLNLIDEYFNESYEKYKENIYNLLPLEFPYYNFTDRRLKKDYNKLCTYENMRIRARLGESSILNFHKSIFEQSNGNLISCKDAWNNKELLKRMVNENLIYTSEYSSQSLLDNFKNNPYVYRPKILSPSLAKIIIDTYLPNEEIIYNPSNNYSSLLLGSCALNKRYLCKCKNIQLTEETQNLIDFHSLDAKIENEFPEIIPNLITEVENEEEIIYNITTQKSYIYIFVTNYHVPSYEDFLVQTFDLDDEDGNGERVEVYAMMRPEFKNI